MVSQSLVPQNGQRGLAMNTPVGLEGMDDFSTADMEIPVIKIVHGVSKMEGAEEHVGQWWNSISGEFAKSLDVVILNGRHSRALFSGDVGEADRPECVSRDGVTGSVYGACSQCDFNTELHPELWNDQSRKRCNKGYTLFLYLPGDDSFAIFTASKTNVAPIRKFNTQLALKLKVPLFGVLVALGVEKQEDKGRKWYTVAPRVKQQFDAAQTAEYRQMAQALRAVSVRIVDEEAPAASENYEGAPSFDSAPSEPGGDPWDKEAAETLLGGKR